MKNYRKYIPIVLIVLMSLSIYQMVSSSINTTREYNRYLSEARSYAKDSITKYAVENYTAALQIKPTPEVYAEVAKYYKSQDESLAREAWCEDFLELYPTSPLAYDQMLSTYYDDKDYESCYDIIEVADKRGISTKYIKSVKDKIMYIYEMDYSSYDDVTAYCNYFIAVKDNDKWGYVNRFGDDVIGAKYAIAKPFTIEGFASVVTVDGEAMFIDIDNNKVISSKGKYVEFGMNLDDIIPAKRKDGKYEFVNHSMEKLFGEYDYASNMVNGVAAVKNGETWKLINEKGKVISSTKYDDIKLDELEMLNKNGRVFAKTGGSYVMLDDKGKQVGGSKFADVVPFNEENSYAAVKIGKSWCFIDESGKKPFDAKYQQARSFANGLAAVKIDGKWGFIDEKGTLVIKNTFEDARDFNEMGSCFVKNGDKWQQLRLYRLNRR